MTSQYRVEWVRSPLLAAALLLLPFGAQAADMPLKAPIAVPVYGWSGFYVGANVGYSFGPWDSTSVAPVFATASTGASPNVKGFVYGGQLGYNWQVSNHLLLGVEADYQLTTEKATNDSSASVGPIRFQDGLLTITTTSANEWKFPWFATIRGRAGYVADDWLLYATGGAAVGRAQFSNVTTATAVLTGPIAFTLSATQALSEAKTRWGWTAGAGVEKALGRNFSAKLEYLYVDLGSYTFLSGTGFDTSVKLRDHIVRLGLNYRFNGPLVARY